MSTPWLAKSKDYESALKGYLFEQYVVSKFPECFFKLLHWRSDKCSGTIRAADNGEPDLIYRYTNRERYHFAVECKYRSNFDKSNKIFLADWEVFHRYRSFENKRKITVFMVIGVGSAPDKPKYVFIIPLKSIGNGTHLSLNELIKFKREAIDEVIAFDRETGLIY